ncbi:UNVERIFIED_CONTAM: hypothetical protein GTU68_065543 [Idotea baltica]|nr:hypothetical protein [Idotea baltica]
MKLLSVYVSGLLFGIGISLSGMANPKKVLNFFDIAGDWDPSLMFVMGGAVVVAFVGYKIVFTRSQPMFDTNFHLPIKKHLDRRLIGGSALFGTGWGIAGFCPGGALPVLSTARIEVILFVTSVIVGLILTRIIDGNLNIFARLRAVR